jgi:hypothetical protein
MMEFNPDGSLKLPGSLARITEEHKQKMRCQQCIKVKKELVSFTSPKKCVLHITLSDAIRDVRFIDTIYNYFRESTQTPTKVIKINDKEIDIEVGTHFRRCTECNNLIGRYREFLNGNLIEDKGSCTYEPRNLAYEDYF